MGAWASVLAALAKLVTFVAVAVKKARFQREETAIKENPVAWFCKRYGRGRHVDADGVHGDATSHSEAKP